MKAKMAVLLTAITDAGSTVYICVQPAQRVTGLENNREKLHCLYSQLHRGRHRTPVLASTSSGEATAIVRVIQRLEVCCSGTKVLMTPECTAGGCMILAQCVML